MDQGTCVVCYMELPADSRKDRAYCSKRCADQGQPPCELDGCTKPRRAKGLCTTHYNQAHAKPVELECAACGKPLVRTNQRNHNRRPACSTICRGVLKYGMFSHVPMRHPSRAPLTCTVPESHPSRVPHTCDVPLTHASRTLQRSCLWCEDPYATTKDAQRYCSKECKRRGTHARRRAREDDDGHTYTWAHVMRILLLLDGRCAYCNEHIDGLPDTDHVVPISRGGSNGNGNVLPACSPCNSDKRDLTLAEWAADRERRGKPPRHTELDRTHPAFAALIPDAITSGHRLRSYAA